MMFLAPTEHQKVLKEALEAGKDPHKALVMHLLKIPEAEVTQSQRQAAKQLNYVYLYNPDFLATVNFSEALKNANS